tara:strand:+ start:13837 stop:17466 length:3630 start_codon:yes stop_codon:yes gene_type:complete
LDNNIKKKEKWNFWIDRGGTFTDIVALDPKGIIYSKKILSRKNNSSEDAALKGINYFLKIDNKNINSNNIHEVRMGTTVATNTLLTHKGEKTVLFITKGFKDALKIGDQSRPDIFARAIKINKPLYSKVYEIDERISKNGKELIKPNLNNIENMMKNALNIGCKSAAIVLMHSWKYPKNEKLLEKLAKNLGFNYVICSHKTIPLIGLLGRGDTTVIDAYLTPKLNQYTSYFAKKLNKTQLLFMKSSGGLSSYKNFKGKDAVLSGPAGGVIAAVEINKSNKEYSGIIGIDMGGTSTDVFHYKDEYERSNENNVAGNKIKVPMLKINTIASGGGSIISFDGQKITVGPESAGAFPGPACYGHRGPATITDCNLILGRIQSSNFPKIFGKSENKALDIDASKLALKKITNNILKKTKKNINIYDLAEGSLNIAIENMSNAIKNISIEKGHDIKNHVLVGYGAAAAQHLCYIAESLNMKNILIHEFAGVLSAYGMGLAQLKSIKNKTVELDFHKNFKNIKSIFKSLRNKAIKDIKKNGQLIDENKILITNKINIKYEGTESSILIEYLNKNLCEKEFKIKYKKRFGFLHLNRKLIIDSAEIEATYSNKNKINIKPKNNLKKIKKFNRTCDAYTNKKRLKINYYNREDLQKENTVNGPAIIFEKTSTIYIKNNWRAIILNSNQIKLKKILHKKEKIITDSLPNPIQLEIFNNMFMSIAEEMGTVLKNTAYSINIKERLDFSCALFDNKGGLIANAPHIPIHLGAMSESIKYVIKKNKTNMNDGDSFIHNNPYHGGTHLPDITIITPIFINKSKIPNFYVASRAHHSDIGGITPGSMPAMSKHINEEGAVFNGEKIVYKGKLNENKINKIFKNNDFPARDVNTNMADLSAQLAAANTGKNNVKKMIKKYGLYTVNNYMKHVKNNAKESIQKILTKLNNGSFKHKMDNGSVINLKIQINKDNRSAIFDFSGTSKQTLDNFNTPKAVTRSAILYVLRTLIKDKIPLNDGCMEPIKILIPNNSLLNPKYPAPVVAGNVETSQSIVDIINGALKVQAACYGTMSNFTFGNKYFGYYETICGGEGASKNHNGVDSIQCHMTNTRLTDPEILELRYPIKIKNFGVRKNSGGKGKFNGGNGTIREIEFLQKMTAVILSNRRIIKPFGIKGAKPGLTGENILFKKDKLKPITLNSCETILVKKGDIITIKTPGGGGYGKKATV